MLSLRPHAQRGQTRIGWLQSAHSFSFGEYYDPRNLGFHTLRVINEDHIAPGRGFGTHPHRDMEILTWVLSGSLAHRDSLGNGSQIRPGELQRMSAGTGIQHSEVNPSPTDPVHLLQIWIKPARPGLAPSYEQQSFSAAGRANQWQRLASPEGRDGSVTIQQAVNLWTSDLTAGQTLDLIIPAGHAVWVQVISGQGRLNDQVIEAGDGVALEQTERLQFETGESPLSVLVFDMSPVTK